MITELRENLEKLLEAIEDDYSIRANIAAKRLRCSVRTIYRLIENNELKAIAPTKRGIRISKKSLIMLEIKNK